MFSCCSDQAPLVPNIVLCGDNLLAEILSPPKMTSDELGEVTELEVKELLTCEVSLE